MQQKDKDEFLSEWKVYMDEEEQKAFDHITNQRKTDVENLELKRQEVKNQYHKFVHSKHYCTLREKEKIYFSVKNYIEADKYSREAEAMVEEEKKLHQKNIDDKIRLEV